MVAAGVDSLLSLFPPGSALDPDGMLTVAGCRTDTLATQFDTPLLVVSEPALRARAREYADGLAAPGRARAWCSPPRRSRARRSSG
jgi:diaminopimelate decarboxylase